MHSQIARLPDMQMDIQTDRCTARNADGHAEQMHEQQKKLNPIEDFTGPARNVPNVVSAKNPWHRWTSIGSVDRYQADEPAERLEDAQEALEKIFGSILFVLVCSGDEHFGSGVGCDGVASPTP